AAPRRPLPPRRGPPDHRGVPGRRQDDAREGARALARRRPLGRLTRALHWKARVWRTERGHERVDVQPLPARARPPQEGNGRPGDGGAREGEAARARQGLDPRGARHRLLPDPPLGGGGGGVPEGARTLPGQRLRPLRARPVPREAGAGGRGERPLQARELAAASLEALPRPRPRPRLNTARGRRYATSRPARRGVTGKSSVFRLDNVAYRG